MNGGLKILIARMETHPEEFEAEGKWISSFNNYKKYMTEEEKDVFWKKLCELKMNEFEQKIVKRLMQDEISEQGELDLQMQQHTKAVQQQLQMLKTLQAGKLQAAKPGQVFELPEPTEKKHLTLFGKLFNYT